MFLIFCLYFLQGEKISTILKAANVDVEPYWPGLFAKALEGVNVKDLITNIGSGVGAAGPAAAVAEVVAAPAAKKEEKKVESEDEDGSGDDMGFGKFLFKKNCLKFWLIWLFFCFQVFSNKIPIQDLSYSVPNKSIFICTVLMYIF